MTPLRLVLALVGVFLLGASGFTTSSCVSHLYDDHLLIDAARAEQIRQIRQLQQPPKPQ